MLYPELFESWWATYPRKVSKKNAYNAWRRIPDKVMPIVEAGLDAYLKKWKKENTPLEMIPYPASWLNGERYYDEIIVDEARGIRVVEAYAEKKQKKIEEKEDQKKIEKIEKTKKNLDICLQQVWRHKIKIEIIVRFPRIWESKHQSRFYYNARIAYYINQYNNNNTLLY